MAQVVLGAESDISISVSELTPALFASFRFSNTPPATEAIDELAIATATCLCRIVEGIVVAQRNLKCWGQGSACGDESVA
jgi:hypothetical protein